MSEGEDKRESVEESCGLSGRVARALQEAASSGARVAERGGSRSEPIHYLWLHVCGEGLSGGGDKQGKTGLSLDEWLNVVDEAAALGARSVIVSAGEQLDTHAEIWNICQWAQDVHGMSVGVYVYGKGLPLSPNDLRALEGLDAGKTRLFVDGADLGEVQAVVDMGVPVYNADAIQSADERRPCQLPHSMTCVGSEGNLYTCGLVLGEENYRLGNVCEKRLDLIMSDRSLPHEIPQGIHREPRRCNACPPLMERLLRGEAGCG